MVSAFIGSAEDILMDKEIQVDSTGIELDGGWEDGSLSDDFQSSQLSGIPKPVPPRSLDSGAAAPLEYPLSSEEKLELDLVLEERVV